MFHEDDFLPLSAVQHVVFCPRRAALVLLEAAWEDNVSTVEGSLFHSRVHDAATECRGPVRIARSVRLRSLKLGLTGQADVVEFHRLSEPGTSTDALIPRQGVALAGTTGVWQPFPVEHKVGKLRHERAYEVQLCAQALCLEEMLGVLVPAGAIFFGKTFRRQEVYFDQSLRGDTESAARLLHEIVCSGKTPRARYEKKCRECSLLSLCLPNITARERSVRSYINKALNTEADEAS